MSEFISIALAFPTVIYTLLLGFALLYWVFVIVGALDIDMFDFGSAADGALEGVDGALDGALEGVDGALDGALEGVDGALEGATEGAAEGAAEAIDGAMESGSVLGILFRLRAVPITVSFSLIALFAWVLSVLGMRYLGGLMGGTLLGVLVGVAAFVLALPLTSLAARPLEPMFQVNTGRRKAEVVGHTATVTTGRVDSKFGHADCRVGNDFLRIEVRANPSKGIKRGQEVLVVDYDAEREAYLVEPLDD